MINTGLKDKVVLITGTNNPHGIGAGVAKAFAAEETKIFLHYYRGNKDLADDDTNKSNSPGKNFFREQSTKKIDEVLKILQITEVEVNSWEADLSISSKIPELFNKVEEKYGQVDILVNNAAHWEADTFIPRSEEVKNKLVELWTDRPDVISDGSFDRIFAVNTRAIALMIKEFAKRHIKREAKWGRIINISTAGAYCFPSEVSYGASKSALEGYTRSAAVELGKFGITVNALALGPVQTGWITPDLEKQLLPSIPVGRVGTPEDVANAIIFLASNRADWITGQKIFIGGGHGM